MRAPAARPPQSELLRRGLRRAPAIILSLNPPSLVCARWFASSAQALDSPRRGGAPAFAHASLRAGSITGIDNDRKEHYLLDDEFQPALGNMTRAEFAALPEWRRVALKKAAGIF